MEELELEPVLPVATEPVVEQPEPVSSAIPPQRMDFSFHGQGGEYFRIWIVNLVLSVLTLTIYSAWAKVRNLRYFYGNTELAGARFDFHGRPQSILVGRLVTLVFVVAYAVLSETAPMAALGLLGVLMLFSPWMVVRSLKFRLGNTSYRNIRFGFDGTVGQAYKYLLFMPLLIIPSLGFAFPFIKQRITRFLLGNVRYGQARLSTLASAGDFYVVYGLALVAIMAMGMMLAVLIGIGALVGVGGVMAFGDGLPKTLAVILVVVAVVILYLVIFAGYTLIGQTAATMAQQYVWNKASLDEHRFESRMRVGPVAKLHLGNILLLIVTLGLAWPWVKVKTARFRINNLTLLAQDGLSGIRAAAVPAGGAVGEEMAEMFDFDFSL